MVVTIVIVFLSLSNRPFQARFDNNGLFLNGVFPQERPTIGEYELVDAFPNLEFEGMKTDVVYMPTLNRFLVVHIDGRIVSFENNSSTESSTTLLDISDKVFVASGSGALSAALHPDFFDPESNQYHLLYLFYSYLPDLENENGYSYMRLSRFSFNSDLTAIDSQSEEVLIQQFDPNSLHNGGDMFFDEMGYLYLTLGDGGKGNDGFGYAQKINQGLFSGLLRIDVEADLSRSHSINEQPKDPEEKPGNWPSSFTQGYAIPNDNPWLNEEGEEDRILEEFFAIGLRSPHRVTYDHELDEIWVADVGQASMEEITLVTKGSNAQWSYKEGTLDGPKEKPDEIIGTEAPPFWTYGRDQGASIIGGIIYRGSKFSDLTSKHVFADYSSRRVWALSRSADIEQLTAVPQGPIDLSQDNDGNIFIVSLGGPIFKLIEKTEEYEPPLWLSETNAFTDLTDLKVNDGFIPYEVNNPLWSDRALKSRWIWLPASTTVDFAENENWKFPKGTVFMKHFDLEVDETTKEQTRLETRFFIVNGRETYGLTYRWNEEQTDARLIEDDDAPVQSFDYKDRHGQSLVQNWAFPSQSQCMSCHNQNAGYILGVKTSQLNRPSIFFSGQNQLQGLNQLGFFSNSISSDLSSFVSLNNLEAKDVTDREKVRSYMDANCSHCHMPGGVDASFDARISTPFEDQGMHLEAESFNSGKDNLLVKPFDLEQSEFWIRDGSLDGNKMPPIGKNLIDSAYLKVLKRWILNYACHEISEEVFVEEGASHVLPDDSVALNISDDFTHISVLQDQSGCDSLVVSNVYLIRPLHGSSIRHQVTNVFPNPVEGLLKIQGAEIQSLVLYDLAGTIVLEQVENTTFTSLLDMSNLQRGIYLLKVKSNQREEYIRILKD